MRILVANDDGIYSPGLCALAEAAARFGDVRIVAPDVEQSSMGHAITATRPLSYRRAHIKEFESYKVNGTPADCVALGAYHWEKVDAVLSGVNLGTNLGNSAWHSGTLAAAKQAALLGLRGIRVITDLVVNHTSDQHPWFQEARSSADSPKRDWYVWSDTPDRYKEARIIFTDTEKSNWTWDEQAQAFFWHRFFSHQPDLNYDNPAVQQAMLEVVDYWLALGVDGFRVDAVPYLYEREGTNCENLPETHAFLKRLRAHVAAKFPNALLLAEANQWPEDVVEYFGDGDEFQMGYHFPIMPRLFMALRQEDRRPIVEILERTPAIPDTCQWGMFLRNHDELTLEMVTDEERDYLYNEYAKDRRMRLNVGIRRRLAPLLDNSRLRIKLLHSLLFSLPGSPFLYYGDEIGMGDNVFLGDRDGVRTPMQWSADRNAGFSAADFEQLYFPVISNPVYGYQSVNVESQRRYDTSLLHWMRQMIHLRQCHHVFGRGTMSFVKPENRAIFAFTRAYENETVLCVFNLSQHAQPVQLDLSEFAGAIPVEMLGKTFFPQIDARPYQLAFGPWGFYWFLLQKVE